VRQLVSKTVSETVSKADRERPAPRALIQERHHPRRLERVCMCVCVRERERESGCVQEREREWVSERESEREREIERARGFRNAITRTT